MVKEGAQRHQQRGQKDVHPWVRFPLEVSYEYTFAA
jgi:hypothetical protein